MNKEEHAPLSPLTRFGNVLGSLGVGWQSSTTSGHRARGGDRTGDAEVDLFCECVTAFGAYVQDVLQDRVRAQLADVDSAPEGFVRAVRDAAVGPGPPAVSPTSPQILNRASFEEIIPRLVQQMLPEQRIDSSDQLERAFQALGIVGIFATVVDRDRRRQGSESEIRTRLDEALRLDREVRKRGTRVAGSRPDRAVANRARDCTQFVVDFAARLDTVVNAHRVGGPDASRGARGRETARTGGAMGGSAAVWSRRGLSLHIAKTPVRVKVHLKNGRHLIGDCHVPASNGRVSDVVNDERPFLIMTHVTIEQDALDYDVVTINKDAIEMLLELRGGQSQV
jgi:hypothetical protein